MRLLIPIYCLLNFFFQVSYSQQNIQPHGTLIAAFICNDGILIASDSRATFTETEKLNGKDSEIVFAYVDSIKKIFNIDNFQMTIAGNSVLANKTWGEITTTFNKYHKHNDSIRSTFYDFKRYLKDSLNQSEAQIFKDNTSFIIAGYEKAKPTLFGANLDGEQYEQRPGRMLHSDTAFAKYPRKYKNVSLNCIEFAPYVRASIYDYAKDKNDNKVGGPVNVIQIIGNNYIMSLPEFKCHYFKWYGTFMDAILNNCIQVNYLYDWSEKKLKKSLRAELNKKRW